MITDLKGERFSTVAVCWIVIFIAAIAALWWGFVHTTIGQQLEAWALEFPTPFHGERWRELVSRRDVWAALVSAGIGAAVVILLLRERSGRLLAQVLTVVLAANITTQVLKHIILQRPRLVEIAPFHNSFPSGHTTAAASLAAVLLLVVSIDSARWVGVLGGLFTAGAGIYTLWGQWHRVSDVLAAVLVVSAWTVFAMLVFGEGQQSRGTGDKSRRSGVLMWLLIYSVGLVVLALGGYALAAVVSQAQVAIAFFAGACATIGMSVSCFSVLTQLRCTRR